MISTKFRLAAILAGTAALPAVAQEITPLTDHDPTEIEGQWSADQMRDATVHGQNGGMIGHAQTIIVGPDRRVDRVLVETDNWLDIGDRVISVPWDDISLTPRIDGISAAIDESDMDDFSLFGDDETANVDGDAYRASALLDSYVNLEGGVGYGYVTDLIFDRDGMLSSVLVSPDSSFGPSDFAGGVYAYPYYDDSTYRDPIEGVYTLPYSQDDVLNHTPYDAVWIEDGI